MTIQARKRIINILEKAISGRRSSTTSGREAYHEDFLQQMLMEDDKASSEESHRLTDAEIKDNILTMIIAG
jgi:cytochrome P450